ncbi:hypothetical protein AB1Y20_000123 [Prymnesium parvum]|uniref:PHD-type domain-containing protein n=1 Tax=Prymnesium parvum TaxID=97485 RepID=A0AB34K9J3_PRYPA
MPPTSPPPPSIFTTECRTLAPPTRAQALALLLHRFSSTLRTKDNALLIRRLFGEAHGTQHCYHSRQDLPSSSPTLTHYRCAIAMRGAECVGAACFRHVAPRRAAAERTFTELLLLAVRSDVERQRIGSTLVQFVKAEASRAHSRALLVISNGHPFWRRPQLELQRELSEREARLFALFIPWNVGVHVRLAEIAAAPDTSTQLEPREGSTPRPPRRPREPATSPTPPPTCADDRPSKRLRSAEVQHPMGRCEQSAPRRVDTPQSERTARRVPRHVAGDSLSSSSRASMQKKMIARPTRQRGAAARVPPAVCPRAPREVKAAGAKKQCAPPTPLLLASDEMEASAAVASAHALLQLRMETLRVAASVAISPSRPLHVALSLSVRTGSGEAHSMRGDAAAVELLSSPSKGGVARTPHSSHHSAASSRGRGEVRRAGRVPCERVEAAPSLTAKRTQRQRAHERKQRTKCSSCGALGAAADDACEGKVLCGKCSAAYEVREYCPVCMALWRRPDGTEEDAEFINCGVCDGWVHLSCDKISKGTGSQWESTEYRCPRCRASAPGECFISMPKRAPLKACASCGQRPRGGSAHGSIRLPSQGTEDEECAVVCTPCKARWESGEYCSICKVLWRTDEAQMMSCDQCKRWAEMMELLPTDDCCFVCAPCRGAEPGDGLWGSGPTCHSCARRPSAFPPGQSSRAADMSGKSVSLCAPCVDQWDKRRYCPVCCKVPAGDTAHEVGVGMLACDGCQLWIHAACEGLTVAGINFMRDSPEQYLCPGCRKMTPCVGLSLPLVMQTVEAQKLVQEQERISTSELFSTDVIGSSLSTQPAKPDPPGQLTQPSSPAHSAIGITDVSTTPKPKTPAKHKARTAVSAAGSTSAAQMDPALQQEQDAAKFASIDASNFEAKMSDFCERMRTVYGSLPFTQNDWKTSILGTLVGLICAQTCRNSWSSIGYANLCATFGQCGGEPNWDLVRRKKPADLEPCIWHGPYFHKKAECIHGLTTKAFEDFGEGTSFDALYSWESNKIQKYLKSIVGISGKSTACLMLYRMGRVAFAVDANVLRIMTRLGWLKCLGIYATEGLCSSDRKAAARVGIVKPIHTIQALAPVARAEADDNSASRPQVGASIAAIENDSILPSPMSIATNLDSTHHAAQANALNGPSTFETKSSSSTADIEDLPKPLKRFSQRAQQYMEDILPTETEPYSRLHGLLYRAHVFMITHGAVLCGETPQCHGCPMREICEYGSLLRSDGHTCDSSHAARVVTPHAAQAGLQNVSQASEKLATEHIHDLAASEMVARVLDTVLSSLSDSEETSRPSYNLSSEQVRDVAISNDSRVAEEDPGGEPRDDGPFDAATLEVAAQEAASSLVAKAFSAALPLPDTLSDDAAEAWMKSIMGTKSTGADTQLCVALEVLDERFAPQHPGDMTPRLLLVHNTIGDYAEGRLLMSPWTAFRGIFPMHGTYFFQNEVFEDEGAGKVRLPLEALGRERPVYIGKSVEGVLRHRKADELSKLFRFGFVCIRRFRSNDGRLLPLVLDQPRLLKYNAMPSNLAQQLLWAPQ